MRLNFVPLSSISIPLRGVQMYGSVGRELNQQPSPEEQGPLCKYQSMTLVCGERVAYDLTWRGRRGGGGGGGGGLGRGGGGPAQQQQHTAQARWPLHSLLTLMPACRPALLINSPGSVFLLRANTVTEDRRQVSIAGAKQRQRVMFDLIRNYSTENCSYEQSKAFQM